MKTFQDLQNHANDIMVIHEAHADDENDSAVKLLHAIYEIMAQDFVKSFENELGESNSEAYRGALIMLGNVLSTMATFFKGADNKLANALLFSFSSTYVKLMHNPVVQKELM